jgi:hypothetical protein
MERTTTKGKAAPKILRKILRTIPVIQRRLENGTDFEDFLGLVEDCDDGSRMADALTFELFCGIRSNTLEPLICSYRVLRDCQSMLPEGLRKMLVLPDLEEPDVGDVGDGANDESALDDLDAIGDGSSNVGFGVNSVPSLVGEQDFQVNAEVIVTAMSRDDEAATNGDAAAAPQFGECVRFCGPPPTVRVRRIPYINKPPLYPRKTIVRCPTATFGRKRKRQEEDNGTCCKQRRLLDKQHTCGDLPAESSHSGVDQDDEESPLFGENIMDSCVEYDEGDDEFGSDGSDFYFMHYIAESADASWGEDSACDADPQPTLDPTPEPTPTDAYWGLSRDAEWMTDSAVGCELGTIWIEHPDHGGLLVRRSARLASRARRSGSGFVM